MAENHPGNGEKYRYIEHIEDSYRETPQPALDPKKSHIITPNAPGAHMVRGATFEETLYFNVNDWKVPDFFGMWRVNNVGKEFAEKILKHNKNNRDIRDHRVVLYRQIIEDGDWCLTGETMTMTINRLLGNGQHRMEALALTDCRIDVLISTGIPDENVKHIDFTAVRPISNVLARMGAKRSTNLGAALNILKRYHTANDSFDTIEWTNANRLHPAEVERMYKERIGTEANPVPSIIYSEDLIHRNILPSLMFPRLAVALHYLFSQKDPEAADDFFLALGVKTDVKTNDPVNLLRNHITGNKYTGGASASDMVKMSFQAKWAIKCWNYRRKGETHNQLRFYRHEGTPDIQ
jgi:hypothetical protein